MTDILAMLHQLGIECRTFEHPPVMTVEEARAHSAGIDAVHTKNLVLKDAAGEYYLVVLPADMQIDLKVLPARIGSKRLRFAPADQLPDLLGVSTGAVSVLAIVNDAAGRVRLIVEASLMDAERIACHPLDNRRTTVIAPEGLRTFLAAIGREAAYVAL